MHWAFFLSYIIGFLFFKGVIPRSFRHIFDRIATAPEDERYLVRASYLEIYQEEIRDLISKDHETKRLELRERPDSGVYVKDLKGEYFQFHEFFF